MKTGATKSPKKTKGFSWRRGYSLESGVTGWRLYRWDCHGKLHGSELYAGPNEPRKQVAKVLRSIAHELRDKVDDIDLKALGVT